MTDTALLDLIRKQPRGRTSLRHLFKLLRAQSGQQKEKIEATIERLAARSELPIVLKGILTAEDARLACEHRAAAIVVSNHGGRQLDGAPATIRALPAVVSEIGGDAEVYLDGGIRRGADIVKAVALGARACLAGRALAYGLGAGGQAGARRAIDILNAELRTVLALAGCPSVRDLDQAWVSGAGHTP